jgi:spermidine synthase
MFAACFLSFSVGFLAFSQEILWVRLFGFTNESLPQAFAFVLSMYFLGIAIGAMIGRTLSQRSGRLWQNTGYILLFASLVDLISPWFYVAMAHTSIEVIIGGVVMVLMSALKAIIFPVEHNLGVSANTSKVGRSISLVYMSNILGATLGPFITGIIMLSVMNTQDCFAVCAELTLVVSLFCFRDDFEFDTLAMGALFAVLILSFIVVQESKQMMAQVASPVGQIHRIIENRYGIVTIYDGGGSGDKVFGGNVYDGETNLDPILNSNHINRLLVIAALTDHPQNVLIVGLSIGTWLKLVTSFPGIKNIDVIETNPGYLDAITDYPQQQCALVDPRVHLYIDDSRRWLRSHPENKYDLIIQNTTNNYRAYSDNLLSREFLLLLKQHMNPGAVLAYNSTGSPYVLLTAENVFSYAFAYENLVIAADFDWRDKLQTPDAIDKLAGLNFDGKLLFPAGSESVIAKYLHEPLADHNNLINDFNNHHSDKFLPEIITDDNLLTEYKYGRSLFKLDTQPAPAK